MTAINPSRPRCLQVNRSCDVLYVVEEVRWDDRVVNAKSRGATQTQIQTRSVACALEEAFFYSFISYITTTQVEQLLEAILQREAVLILIERIRTEVTEERESDTCHYQSEDC